MTVSSDTVYVPPSAAAVALEQLRAHPVTLAQYDGDPARIRGPVSRQDPTPVPRAWPQLVVITAGDPLGDLRHLVQGSVVLEVWGDPAGGPSPHALRERLQTALAVLAGLPARRTPGPVVVTSVRVIANGGPAPLPTGQDRWAATALLTMHG